MMPLLHQASASRNRRRNARTIRRQRLSSRIEQLERRDLLAFDISLFADINQQGVSAAVDSLVEFKGEAFFVADDGRSGSELWRSDGTMDGTRQVADLDPCRKT